MKLAVKNRRLAEVLTRDAAELFTRDKKVAKPTSPASSALTREVVAEALPDVLLAPPSLRDGVDDEIRTALKHRCDHVAASVGVRCDAAHLWSFDDGTAVHVRVI
ncbi:MAG TPA: hypothetical protein VFH17_05845, partial [Coriobacteriia bacterium]|nr:hypothetical protein [Coriobacteriia bacterium]